MEGLDVNEEVKQPDDASSASTTFWLIWGYTGPLLYAIVLIYLLGGPLITRFQTWRSSTANEETVQMTEEEIQRLREAEHESRMKQQSRINDQQELKQRLRDEREAAQLASSAPGGVTVAHRGNYAEEESQTQKRDAIQEQDKAYSTSLEKDQARTELRKAFDDLKKTVQEGEVQAREHLYQQALAHLQESTEVRGDDDLKEIAIKVLCTPRADHHERFASRGQRIRLRCHLNDTIKDLMFLIETKIPGGIAGRTVLESMPRRMIFACPSAVDFMCKTGTQSDSDLKGKMQSKAEFLESCIERAKSLKVDVRGNYREFLETTQSKYLVETPDDHGGVPLEEKVFDVIAPRTTLLIRDLDNS